MILYCKGYFQNTSRVAGTNESRISRLQRHWRLVLNSGIIRQYQKLRKHRCRTEQLKWRPHCKEWGLKHFWGRWLDAWKTVRFGQTEDCTSFQVVFRPNLMMNGGSTWEWVTTLGSTKLQVFKGCAWQGPENCIFVIGRAMDKFDVVCCFWMLRWFLNDCIKNCSAKWRCGQFEEHGLDAGGGRVIERSCRCKWWWKCVQIYA